MASLSEIWRAVRDEFRRAFAIPDESLTDEEHHLLKLIAIELVKRNLSAPAVFTFETFRPLNFIGSRAMIVLGPVIEPLVNNELYERIRKLMEKRPALEQLNEYIEDFRDNPAKMEDVEGSLSLWGGVSFEDEEADEVLYSRGDG